MATAAKVEDKNQRVNVDGADGKSCELMSDVLKLYIGQRAAILCARFNYRGIVSHVGKDYVTLSQPRAVESSGASSQPKPTHEDPIGSSVQISLGAVELVYQPHWCFADLDS